MRIIGLGEILEEIGATGQCIGDDRRPALQIDGGLHHHGGVGVPGNGELKILSPASQAKSGSEDLRPWLIGELSTLSHGG